MDYRAIFGNPSVLSGNLDGLLGNLDGLQGNLDGLQGNPVIQITLRFHSPFCFANIRLYI